MKWQLLNKYHGFYKNLDMKFGDFPIPYNLNSSNFLDCISIKFIFKYHNSLLKSFFSYCETSLNTPCPSLPSSAVGANHGLETDLYPILYWKKISSVFYFSLLLASFRWKQNSVLTFYLKGYLFYLCWWGLGLLWILAVISFM